MKESTYLGDAVYASVGPKIYGLVLCTDHADHTTSNNVIYLEPEVVRRLVEFAIRTGVLPKGGSQ